jgi:hypothetical protein
VRPWSSPLHFGRNPTKNRALEPLVGVAPASTHGLIDLFHGILFIKINQKFEKIPGALESKNTPNFSEIKI